MSDYLTIEEIKEANRKLGGVWFDQSFFNSIVHPEVYGGTYFISSEQDTYGLTIQGETHWAWNGERRYSLRKANPNGSISTVGGFGEFATLTEAQAMAREYEAGRIQHSDAAND